MTGAFLQKQHNYGQIDTFYTASKVCDLNNILKKDTLKIDTLKDVPSPSLLLDVERMDENILAIQQICNAHSTQLWPHIKTHKMVEVAKRQLAGGAAGLTCAKIGEAEAILPAFAERNRSGGKSAIFIAHSIVDETKAPRLRRLSEKLDELILACTSEAHAPVLERVLAAADVTVSVMMAVDTGLGREGARNLQSAVRLAKLIGEQPHMKLRGIYTHEGHLYIAAPSEANAAIAEVHRVLLETRDAVREESGISDLVLWPGCSVSAERMATLPEISAVRPGAYVFADLFLSEYAQVKTWEQQALTILATVVDIPTPELALIDAGSKVFSSDRTPEGIFGREFERRDLQVTRVSEEHGFVTGSDVGSLQIGQRLRFVPAHVCPVINLADWVIPIEGNKILERWRVDGRGCVQ